jgi:hypothetical protein
MAEPPAEIKPAAEPGIEYSMLAHGNEEHPTERMPDEGVPAQPVSMPVYTVILPPLIFSASSPVPPPDPEPDTVLLIREAQVSPDWEFSGHVDPPEFATDLQRALGQNGQLAAKNAHTGSVRKTGGFWAAIRRLFGAGDMDAKAE